MAIAVVASVGIVGARLFGPGSIQLRRMRIASDYSAQMKLHVSGDPAFEFIWLRPFTGLGGSLQVFGVVQSENDLSRLQDLINSDPPSVSIDWEVDIQPELTGEEREFYTNHPFNKESNISL